MYQHPSEAVEETEGSKDGCRTNAERIITSTTLGPTWITTRNTRRDDSGCGNPALGFSNFNDIECQEFFHTPSVRVTRWKVSPGSTLARHHWR